MTKTAGVFCIVALVIPVAVLMLVIEKAPVRRTGVRKKRTTRVSAGAIKMYPSLADT